MRLIIQFLILAIVSCPGVVTRLQASPRPYRQDTSCPSGTRQPLAPASIGPFELTTADGSSKIRFQFAAQLRTTFESVDQGPDKKRAYRSLMEARRVRLILSGTALESAFSYRLHLSTAPRSPELMDFYFNYRITRHLQFRYGQYKVPFTRYRMQSFQRLTFADWAIVTRYFGAERQMGFAVHNGYEKPPVWGYVFGAFTGANARASHAVGLAEIYGEVTPNPSSMADPGPSPEFHPELFLHLAHRAKGIRVQSDSDEDREGFRYSIGTSASWDLDPAARTDFHLRLATEGLVKYQGASAMCVGYAGFVKIGDLCQSSLAMSGGLVQASYRIHRRFEISTRYAIVDLRDVLINDVSEHAEKAATELTIREEELTFGLNCYVAGHALKWQNDAGWLRHSRRNGMSDDLVARSQWQVAF